MTSEEEDMTGRRWVAALTIADSIYTYIAMRTDGAKSLQIEKSMESLKY